jgi:hypothetical protein
MDLLAGPPPCGNMQRELSNQWFGQEAHRMTVTEWLTFTNPYPMLNWLRDKATDEKLRKFACRCCRLWDGFCEDNRVTAALQVAEWYLEGRANIADFRTAHEAARRSFEPDEEANAHGDPSWTDFAIMLTHPDAWSSAYCVSWAVWYKTGIKAAQCPPLREIFEESPNGLAQPGVRA